MLRLGPDFVLRCAPVLMQHRAATFVPALFLFPYVTFVGLRAVGKRGALLIAVERQLDCSGEQELIVRAAGFA